MVHLQQSSTAACDRRLSCSAAVLAALRMGMLALSSAKCKCRAPRTTNFDRRLDSKQR
ncbi:hypothetical protein PR003_g12892 [Phytophthora rubi]|uniref:Uncharacterized protein n=1 Tax=Phytophthora rubi TaxID=129364 RepID=A0A6A3M8A1_9STRA|nr:hypothetical protein PR001_g12629 [Phytophthora rubi]KAE9335679.1 hypothetical protein PR003_g12892 [Phytophthora rubi]